MIRCLRDAAPEQQRYDARYPVKLKDSFHYRQRGELQRDIYIAPFSSAFKFIYVTEGTAPHKIRPRTKGALYWEGAPHPVLSVNHPGTRANPFHLAGLANYDKGVAPKIHKPVAEGMANGIAAVVNASGGGGGDFGGFVTGVALGSAVVLGIIMTAVTALLENSESNEG